MGGPGARRRGALALATRFPSARAACASAGLQATDGPLPVAPAAHYHMGGVATDGNGKTTVPGLWACGEVGCTGAHGANRLASNSLLEALVFGAVVAGDIRRALGSPSARPGGENLAGDSGTIEEPTLWWVPGTPDSDALRSAVGQGLGVLRSAHGIEDLLRAVRDLVPPGAAGELANMGLVARLIASAALLREESRGAHRRSDFPRRERSFAWRRLATASELFEAAAGATVSR